MVKMVQMLNDGRNVSHGCQMVYEGVRWSKYVRWLTDGCQMVYDGVVGLYRERVVRW